MSVKGFYINGEVQHYDYNALDNKPDDGLTEATKSALLQLARKVAYIDEHGEDYYQDLYDSFYGNFVNVTHLLTNCYSSNTSTTAKVGAAYTAIISPNPGYTLTGANASITMGGLNVTGAYSNGVINIPNVTGDLVITVTAMSAVSSISAVYTPGQNTTKTIDPTRIYAYISESGTWVSYNDSYCVCVPVTVGKQYNLHFSTTESSLAGAIFRYGFSNTNTPSGQSLSGVVRSTPQDQSNVTITATSQYLVIQLSAAEAPGAISNGYLTLTEFARTIYDTDTLDILKADLVVTALYSDSSTQTIPAADYTLSGTLTAGTSTITVSYGGKTATFSVAVEQFWMNEWDFSMGKLEDQEGWATDTRGTFSASLVSSGERITTDRDASNLFQIFPTTDSGFRYMTDGYGVIEVSFIGHVDTSTGSKTSKIRVCCAKDSTYRFHTHIVYDKFRLYDNMTDSAASTAVADYANDIEYTERLVLKGNYADLYINGELVKQNVDVGTILSGGLNYIMVQGLGSGYYIDLRSVKIRVGEA